MMLFRLKWDNNQYLLASIVVLLATVLINRSLLNDDVATLHEKPSLEQIEKLKSEPLNTAVKIKLTHKSLPEPPNGANRSKKPSIPDEVAPHVLPSSKKAPSQIDTNIVKTKMDTSIGNEEQSGKIDEQKYEQFVALDGNERRLYFYDNTESELAKTIDYMHRCLGIGLAAFDGKQLTELSLANNTSYSNYSKILREVSGFKSNYEQALIETYAPGQHLIRLYPKWFDMNLATLIAAQIGNQALTQFSGAYVLSGNQLQLTEIRVNHSPVQGRWTLLGKC